MIKDSIEQYTNGLQHVGIPTLDMTATTDFWKKFGFTLKGSFENGPVMVKFFELNNLVIETWEASIEEANQKVGAINHISIDTDDAEALFAALKGNDLNVLNDEVQQLPFWENGIKFFNIQGPNQEIVEFCEIVK